MRWGPLNSNSELVYFGGSTEHTAVELGGASGHVLGVLAPAEHPKLFAPSTLPGILSGVTAAMAAGEEPAPVSALATIYNVSMRMFGAKQEVEFLAKRLLHGPNPYPRIDAHNRMMVLLGTPLFVALAD